MVKLKLKLKQSGEVREVVAMRGSYNFSGASLSGGPPQPQTHDSTYCKYGTWPGLAERRLVEVGPRKASESVVFT